MKYMSVITLLLCLAGNALSIPYSSEQQAILERKALKYGLESELLQAAVTVEIRRSESDLLADGEAFSWATENTARLLVYSLQFSRRPHKVFRVYARVINNGSSARARDHQLADQLYDEYRRLKIKEEVK